MALANIAKMTTATIGTGTVTLGTAVSGFLTFAEAGAVDGLAYSYGIEDNFVNGVPTAREVGRGVYTAAGGTLTRASVLKSTNSNNALNLSGSAQVYITALAEDFAAGSNTQVQFNDSGAFGGDAGFTYDKTTNVIDNTGGQFRITGQAAADGGTSPIPWWNPTYHPFAGLNIKQTVTDMSTDVLGALITTWLDPATNPAGSYMGIYQVVDTSTASLNNKNIYGMYNDVYAAADSGTIRYITGSYNLADLYGDADVLAIHGVVGHVDKSGTGTATIMYGVETYATVNEGTATDVYGVYTMPVRTFGGTVTRAHGIFVDVDTNDLGTVANNYGIYIKDQSGTGSNPYNLYSEGSGRNYFGAGVEVGSALVKQTPVTLASLPSAATAGAGARAMISDWSAGTFGNAVTGGGSAVRPVYSNGTSWLAG